MRQAASSLVTCGSLIGLARPALRSSSAWPLRQASGPPGQRRTGSSHLDRGSSYIREPSRTQSSEVLVLHGAPIDSEPATVRSAHAVSVVGPARRPDIRHERADEREVLEEVDALLPRATLH